METDPWLERWRERIGAQAMTPEILELGCGEGRDTRFLLSAGFDRVTALDISEQALAECRKLPGSPRCLLHDLREPLPFADGTYEVVLASLCLHYFSWDITGAAMQEIWRVLKRGGLLLCRVNSTRDVHYGAAGHAELGHHYYRVGEKQKRFFDRTDIETLFDPSWRRLAVQELEIDRYAKPKTVWEVVLTKG
ncbi:hypothetical protein DAETH_21800 [Deinococcus aetherius]|uniref:Methyltransferase domain-containing protein n=1 Tax=Deinococcus aetherius TaxID=200252 RepID=A0ABM8AEN5_9DEIO|nr:class I SAM-dependent methyltransferase [Deinococcus aetherius]BDP42211.1 hypothetical protein DAETH_21800 [Deinococcus aetherius]